MSVALSHWGRTLVALALFGLLVELLLPSRQTEGYVRLIVGLVLLTAVVSPILGVVHGALRDGIGSLTGGSATSIGGVLAAESSPGTREPAMVARLFAREVGRAAAALAGRVPGVGRASARATVGRRAAAYGQVTAVAVVVRPTAAAGRDGAALARRTASAVAAGLGLAAADVRVRVLRPLPGPAP